MNQHPYGHPPYNMQIPYPCSSYPPPMVPPSPYPYPPPQYPYYPPFPRSYRRKQKRRYYVDDSDDEDYACPLPVYYPPPNYYGMQPYMYPPAPHQHVASTEVCDEPPITTEEDITIQEEECHTPPQTHEDDDCDSIPVDMIDIITRQQECQNVPEPQKVCSVSGDCSETACQTQTHTQTQTQTQTHTQTQTTNTNDDHKVTFVIPKKKKVCPHHHHHNGHQHHHHV